MSAAAPLAQIALCTSDVARSVQLYSHVLGFADAGGRVIWGPDVARVQALGDDCALELWWLVGRQELMQLEFFHHTTPPQRPLPPGWRPCDLGWTRFGVAVPDFDAALERLAGLGVATITEPRETDGLRRVCFRDPYAGCVVELLEEGRATPGGVRPRFFDLVPAVVYATVSVADIERAQRFFVGTLGLTEAGTALHGDEHEGLWGLAGARCERLVLRAGDAFLEVVRYEQPAGRPRPAEHRLSDQGFMNVALGYRDLDVLRTAHERVVGSGYHANVPPPQGVGASYVYDDAGNSFELLYVPREFDRDLGFVPREVFMRRPAWPKPSAAPARG